MLLDEKVAHAAISDIMKSEGMRAFLFDLLDHAQYFNDGFDKDPQKMAYTAGRRSVGLYMIEKLKEADHDNFSTFIKRYFDERRRD